MKEKYGKDWKQKGRFSYYNGEDEMVERHDRRKTDSEKLAEPNFYLTWSPGI